MVAFSSVSGHTMVAFAVAAVAILPALLLSGASRAVAIGCILLAFSLFVDVFRFEVDPARRQIRIRTMWWGCCERSARTYAFSEVAGLREAELGDGIRGYRWKFKDGATYELNRPLDQRVLDLFLEKSP